jgi:hypothetical protein
MKPEVSRMASVQGKPIFVNAKLVLKVNSKYTDSRKKAIIFTPGQKINVI